MNRFIYIVIFTALLPIFLSASTSMSLNSNEIFDMQKGELKIKNYPVLQENKQIVAFDVKTEKFNNILFTKPELLNISQFPVSATKNSDIELTLTNFNFNQTKIYGYKNKIKTLLPSPKSIMYSGKIKGEEHSLVTLVYSNGFVFGYIQQEDGTVTSLGPTRDSDLNTHILAPHNLATATDEDGNLTSACLTDDFTGIHNEQSDLLKYKDADKLQYNSTLLRAPLICEGAYDFYLKLGSNDNKIEAYIISVIAMTSKIYTEFINVELFVSEIHLRKDAESDPYYSNTKTLSEKLQKMPNIWTNYKNQRALVVLFADLNNQPANTVIAGISMGGEPFIGSLCNKNRGYCVLGIKGPYQYPTFNYTWDVNVAAHEIGHNFSAPHTHNCYWNPLIDTCVTRTKPMQVDDACVTEGNPKPIRGTIMSYCHVSNSTRTVELVFHPRFQPLMRRAAEDCDCMTNPENTPLIQLLEPLGDKNYKAGGNMSIRWSTTHISFVNIMLSTNNGKTWDIEIGKNIFPEDSVLSFEVPHINTDSALVRISSSDDSEIFDTSFLPFSIHYQEIVFKHPVQGDSYSKYESLFAEWKQNFTDILKLEFTSDGGNSWQEFTQTSQLNYEKSSLGIVSDNCKLRLTSMVDGTVTESVKFSIGEPTAKILYPNGGELWAVTGKYPIKWESSNTFECFIEYSINNGTNWKKVVLTPVLANPHEFIWQVPTTAVSKEVLVRIKESINDEVLDASDGVFEIHQPSVDVKEETTVKSTLSFQSVSPNPLSNKANITISNTSEISADCELYIVDETGKMAYSVESLFVPAGGVINHTLETNYLSQGNYLLILKSKSGIISNPIKIVR